MPNVPGLCPDDSRHITSPHLPPPPGPPLSPLGPRPGGCGAPGGAAECLWDGLGHSHILGHQVQVSQRGPSQCLKLTFQRTGGPGITSPHIPALLTLGDPLASHLDARLAPVHLQRTAPDGRHHSHHLDHPQGHCEPHAASQVETDLADHLLCSLQVCERTSRLDRSAGSSRQDIHPRHTAQRIDCPEGCSK